MTPYRCGSCKTIVAHKASPLLLVVPHDTAFDRDMTGDWWVRCRCGRWIVWRGALARQMETAA